jgi:hypothetical protein
MRRSTVLSLAPQLVFPCCRLGFISKYYTWLKSNMTGKHSSLFVRSVSDAGKKFNNIDTRGQCYKTFSVLNLRIFVVS